MVKVQKPDIKFNSTISWIYAKYPPCDRCSEAGHCTLAQCNHYDEWAFTKNVPIEDVPLYINTYPRIAAYRLKKGK